MRDLQSRQWRCKNQGRGVAEVRMHGKDISKHAGLTIKAEDTMGGGATHIEVPIRSEGEAAGLVQSPAARSDDVIDKLSGRSIKPSDHVRTGTGDIQTAIRAENE